jgi:hypothetical protein
MHPGRWSEIGRFARRASADVDPSVAPHRSVRRAAGAPAVRSGLGGSSGLGGGRPIRHRHWVTPPRRPRSRTCTCTTVDAPRPPVGNQPIRPAHIGRPQLVSARIGRPRPVRCPRRPTSTCQVPASANLDLPAAAHRPARRATGAPAARSQAGRLNRGSAVAWPTTATPLTAPPTTSIKESACAMVDAPRPPVRNRATRPARIGQRRPASRPSTDRRGAQSAHRRPDPGRAAQPGLGGGWPATVTGSRHPPRCRSRTPTCTTVDAPRPPARNQPIRPARIGQPQPASHPASGKPATSTADHHAPDNTRQHPKPDSGKRRRQPFPHGAADRHRPAILASGDDAGEEVAEADRDG